MTPQNEDNVYEEFYENGQLKEKGNRSKDIYEIYYESGQLKARASDPANSILSKNKLVREKNKVERKFSNSHIHWGLYDEFYPNGKLKLKYRYVANYSFGYLGPIERGKYIKSDGEREFFQIQTMYRELEQFGHYEEYYENGNLKLKSNFAREKESTKYWHSGQYEEYFNNGQLKQKHINTKYGKSGPYEERYENGTLKEMGTYLIVSSQHCIRGFYPTINIKIGPFKSFYKNGQIKEILIFNSFEIPESFFEYNCSYDETDYNLKIRDGRFYNLRPGESYESFYENGQLKIYFGINVPDIKSKDYYFDRICPFEEYYENGQLKIKTTLLKREGIDYNLHKEFDIYSYDQIDPCEEYYENGQLKE